MGSPSSSGDHHREKDLTEHEKETLGNREYRGRDQGLSDPLSVKEDLGVNG